MLDYSSSSFLVWRNFPGRKCRTRRKFFWYLRWFVNNLWGKVMVGIFERVFKLVIFNFSYNYVPCGLKVDEGQSRHSNLA
jgi:hypothetical protein